MQPITDNYPVFEANQVLTNAHLNQSFSYLDEQQRLTRANLIGIGIVCGLNVSLDNPTQPTAILLTKGCGITSEGYLLVEPDDVTLTSYRNYALPDEIVYPSFINSATDLPYSLWELFPDGEPETTALTGPDGFLNDKAVVLFLELKKEGLRNCSANNCDDKGAKVTTRVRRLLIAKTDLDVIIAAADTLAVEMPDTALQLNLPDLRLPRYDAPATSPATSNDVLAAFLNVFAAKKLAAALADALTQAYQAFLPILKNAYDSNPFANFAAQFGFLDNVPVNVDQVRFLPYYYDFFDDLIHAYDEFRDNGMELLCACCPPSGLFPRHLLLSLLYPASDVEALHYRQFFLASAAVSGCEARSQEVVMLFRRMVEMVTRFTLTPLPLSVATASTDAQIRITPSRHGDMPLSDKAVPYYYLYNGVPPLYQLWNPALNRRFKANRNLGYRADEYSPAAPAFITEPLAYDLEPYNFLRIEGHLGKSYQTVLNTLLGLKAKYRLPIDIIALRTGTFDAGITVDMSKESCRFQDLEMLYAATRGETLCALVKTLIYFYNLPFQQTSPVTTAIKSQFAIINAYAPDFLVQPNTLGRVFEDFITSQGGVVPEIDGNVLASWINIFPPQDTLVYYSFFYIIKLSDALPSDFSAVNFSLLETRFNNLGIVVTAIENRREQGRSSLEGNAAVLTWEEIDDRLEDLLNTCQPEVLKTMRNEYENRIQELKKKQFFSNFLQDHPGIQHKAGVPVGGTFIIVYHQDPATTTGPAAPLNLRAINAGVDPMASGVLLSAHTSSANLHEFVLTPIIFDFFTPRKSVSVAAVRETAAKVADSKIADLKTDALKQGLDSAAVISRTTDSVDTSASVKAGTLNINPSLFDSKFAAAMSDTGRITINQEVLDAVQRLQAQPVQINPDIRLILNGLNSLLPVLPIIPISPGKSDVLTEADQIIATAVNGMADGTVIADFYLPYLCCSGCAPVQFILPKTPPTFTVSIGCTEAGDEVPLASVTVTAKDGTPPYRIKIDEHDYQELDNPYLLSAGEHTLTVQDADNVLSAPQTITIVEPINIGNPEFVCATDGQSYVATVPITGGVPPYSVNGVLISGSSFTSPSVASGSELPLHITDLRQCAFETTLTHTCPPPCNLPDDGLSRRCAHRLWLQPAIDGEIYETYEQTSAIKLRFNGSDIDLDETSDLLQIAADALNNDFQNAIAAVIKVLNEVINKGIADKVLPALDRERLAISYEPSKTDPFGIFWIEHFKNDRFSIEFEYRLKHSVASGNFAIRYSNEQDVSGAAFDGAIFINHDREDQETRVPAFACSERDQCTGSDFAAICDGGFDVVPAFVNDRVGDNTFIFAISENMPTTGIAAWVWEFTTNTDLPFYVGEKVTVVWNPGGLIRLTAINDKGCFSVSLNDQR